MPPLALTQSKYALAPLGMSVKSVPGCLVTIAPIGIGAPLAFWPLPRPHFDAAALVELAAEVLVAGGLLAEPEPELVLDVSLSLPPHAPSASDARAAAIAAADRG
jgi:hypothetical protein